MRGSLEHLPTKAPRAERATNPPYGGSPGYSPSNPDASRTQRGRSTPPLSLLQQLRDVCARPLYDQTSGAPPDTNKELLESDSSEDASFDHGAEGCPTNNRTPAGWRAGASHLLLCRPLPQDNPAPGPPTRGRPAAGWPSAPGEIGTAGVHQRRGDAAPSARRGISGLRPGIQIWTVTPAQA